MTSSREKTDKEVIHNQILQLKEVIAAKENDRSRSVSIRSDEILNVMIEQLDENESIHPRMLQILNTSVELEEVTKALKRLENDLNDLDKDSDSLYDPFEHEMNGDESQDNSENISNGGTESDENPAEIRDINQRPLSAYKNT